MTNEQELIIKFQEFEKRIQQTQQQKEAIEQALIELNLIKEGLNDLKEKKEILAQIGKGIFAKAKLNSKELIVNVGEKIFVKKSIKDTKKLINEQIIKLNQAKKELDKILEELDQELTKTMLDSQKKKD